MKVQNINNYNDRKNNKSFGMKEITLNLAENVSRRTVRLIDESLLDFYKIGGLSNNLEIRSVKLTDGDKVSFKVLPLNSDVKKNDNVSVINCTHATAKEDLVDTLIELFPEEVRAKISELKNRVASLNKGITERLNPKTNFADASIQSQIAKFDLSAPQSLKSESMSSPELDTLPYSLEKAESENLSVPEGFKSEEVRGETPQPLPKAGDFEELSEFLVGFQREGAIQAPLVSEDVPVGGFFPPPPKTPSTHNFEPRKKSKAHLPQIQHDYELKRPEVDNTISFMNPSDQLSKKNPIKP